MPNCIDGQNDCEVPLPPELISITILPETSAALLIWTPSPSPGIVAYIVYIYETRDGNTEFFAVDTLWNPDATSYSDTRTQYKSFRYRIAAFRAPVCASRQSNILSTIFAEATLDSCTKKITIIWNKYTPPSPQIVTKYTIQISQNGSIFSEIGSVTSETTSFILSDFTIDDEYCFRVIANLNGGAVSSSYKSCVATKMQTPPDWINADYATVVEGDGISLSFSIDPYSETDLFALERRDGYSGPFSQIALIAGTDAERIIYTDKTIRKDAFYFYRLSAVNNCNIRSATSNLASNIVLKTQNTGNEIVLQWNKYYDWLGSVSSYSVFADKGNGYNELAVTGPADTSLTISIPDIMYTLPKGNVCFYITASETGNPYGITGVSVSDTSCISIEETVSVPNIFSPDGDGINDQFRPVITFVPLSYQLLITDRQRKPIFETRDFYESWDGSADGDPVSQGVFLWYLKINTPSGKTITRTGTLTVIKN